MSKISVPSSRWALRFAAGLALGGLPGLPVLALDLTQKPLFIATGLPANLIITLDDSGSMQWAFAPDDVCVNGLAPRRFKSAHFNPLYYDPTIRYVPPLDVNKAELTTSFTSAWINGFDQSRGSVNLATSFRPTASYNPATAGPLNSATSFTCGTTNNNLFMQHPAGVAATVTTPTAAYYYVWSPTNANCTATDILDEDCYSIRTVGDQAGPSDVDGDGDVDGDDERRNFAIWYSFYRTRNLTTVTGATRAFSHLDPTTRVAWQAINSCASFGTTCNGWGAPATNLDNRIRPLADTHLTRFYNWMFRLPATGGTPLRTALGRAGNYYRTTTGTNNPYAYDPQVTQNPEYSCRQNYTIVMTDGRWNSDNVTAYGNKDGSALSFPDNTSFTPGPPYADTNSNSLADIAFHFWATDLRSDLSNDVPTYFPHTTERTNDVEVLVGGKPVDLTAAQMYVSPRNDPATWQHMVTFTVGLGLTNSLGLVGLNWQGSTYRGSYDSLVSGTTVWPATTVAPSTTEVPGNVADLWHAAIDSRGQFFSADNPASLADAFQTIVDRVQQGVGAGGTLGANSTVVQTGSAIYQGKFNATDWSGDLVKIPLEADGSIRNPANPSTDWKAGCHLLTPVGSKLECPVNGSTNVDPATRAIVTYNPVTRTAVPFRWEVGADFMSPAQKALLKGTDPDTIGQQRVAYLRGDGTREGTGTTEFRRRPNTKLGDIVNSSPVLVGAVPNSGFPSASYASFRDHFLNSPRREALYVGANDGMLHAFDERTGEELFAYVPSPVFRNLRALTTPGYSHRFFVDGALAVGDVELPGWKTVLAGGLGRGGQGIYALDVTDGGAVADEAKAAASVLWEFTDIDDKDLGYTYGTPQFARMANDKWAVIIGNGYNNTETDGNASTTGNAVVYVLFIQEGADGTWAAGDVIKLDSGVGSTTDPNGMATPLVADVNGDGRADFIYAGDLKGNVWRFDVRSGSPSAWASSSSRFKLFTAKDSSGNAQPITTQVQVAKHSRPGYLVLFGTGQALQEADLVSTNFKTQTFYGIWDRDKGQEVLGRNELQQHAVEALTASNGLGEEFRFVDTQPVDWATQSGWYLDFPSSNTTGERSISDSILSQGRIIFVTAIPPDSPCDKGGTSWLMELDALTGARLTYTPFDVNHDKKFDTSDMLNGKYTSGKRLDGGITGKPLIIGCPPGQKCENKYHSFASGSVGRTLENVSGASGRLSWREIMR